MERVEPMPTIRKYHGDPNKLQIGRYFDKFNHVFPIIYYKQSGATWAVDDAAGDMPLKKIIGTEAALLGV